MEEEDDENEDGNEESEDNSDHTEEEADSKVADMQQNQQQYIQICSSSAQILQLLSRLVPGTGISGQTMNLENVTEESEDSTAESEASSSSPSSAMSDDNSGCVIWAEPIMTCELGLPWKPYCNDVRRLPRGVRPEDIKNKRHLGSGGSCDKGSGSCAARNTVIYSGNRKDGAHQSSNYITTSSQNDTRARGCGKDDCSKPAVKESQMLKVSDPNIRVTQEVFKEAMTKISVAADTIKRARNILATVGNGRQTNNNNNPEVSGESGNLNSEAGKKGKNNSEKKANTDRHDKPATEMNTTVEETSGGGSQGRPKNLFLHLLTGSTSITNFPDPILVKAAEVQGHSACDHPETKEHADSVGRDHCESMADWAKKNPPLDQGAELFDKNSSSAGLSSHFIRNPSLGQYKVSTESNASKLVRTSRVTGQLYRYPSNNSTLNSKNRTQQSISLGATQTEQNVLPTPVDLPVIPQRIKQSTTNQYPTKQSTTKQDPTNQSTTKQDPTKQSTTKQDSTKQSTTKQDISDKFTLDFNVSDIRGQGSKRHIITLANLKSALDTVLNNLKQQGVGETNESSGPSLETKSTVSNFTITEIDSLNGSLNYQADRDTQSSETSRALCSDVICEANAADTHAVGDGTLSNADLTTEVETIFYCEHRSSKQSSSLEAEGNCSQDDLSSIEAEVDCETMKKGSVSSTHAHVLSCEMSPVNNDDDSNVPPRKSPSDVRNQMPFSKTCSDGPDSLRDSSNIIDTNYHIHNSQKSEAEVCETKVEIINREENESRATRESCEYMGSRVNDNVDECGINRISQIGTIRSTVEITTNNIPHNFNCKVRKVKSVEDCDFVYAVRDSFKSQEAAEGSGRITVNGDKCSHELEVFAWKRDEEFPPTIHEGGDSVEISSKSSGLNNNPANSSPHDMARKEIHFSSHARSCESSRRPNIPRKFYVSATAARKGQHAESSTTFCRKYDKKQTDNQLEQSKNCLSDQEKHMNDQSNDSGKVFHERFVHLGASEVVCNHDNIVSANINKEENLPIIVFEGEGNQKREGLISESFLLNYQRNTNLHKDIVNCLPTSSLNHNYVINLCKHKQMSQIAKEDVKINSTKKLDIQRSSPVESSLKKTCRKLSSNSLGKRFCRRRHSSSKIELLKENNKEEIRPEREEIASNKLLPEALTTNLKCQGTELENITKSCRNVQAACKKPVLVLPNLQDSSLAVSENSHNGVFPNAITDREVEGRVSSSANRDDNLHSSRRSLDTVSLITVEDLAPGLLLSTAVAAPSSTVLLNEETDAPRGGFKVRFRQFFAQCLRPFWNKN